MEKKFIFIIPMIPYTRVLIQARNILELLFLPLLSSTTLTFDYTLTTALIGKVYLYGDSYIEGTYDRPITFDDYNLDAYSQISNLYSGDAGSITTINLQEGTHSVTTTVTPYYDSSSAFNSFTFAFSPISLNTSWTYEIDDFNFSLTIKNVKLDGKNVLFSY